MTTGVPFPKEALDSAAQVGVTDATGRSVPMQARVSSTWGPKGSVRWLLLDSQAPLTGEPTAEYRLRYGADATAAASGNTLEIREDDLSQFEVVTGPLAFVVRRDRFDFIHQAWRVRDGKRVSIFQPSPESGPYVVNDEGTVFRAAYGPADEVFMEERGPLRSVICAKGWFYSKSGEKYTRYIVRIHAFAGAPFVRALYTFIVMDDSDHARFRDIGLHVPVRGSKAFFGGDAGHGHALAKGQSVYLLQYDSDKFFVKRSNERAQWEASPPGKRSPGWARVSGDRGDVTLAVRDFWQQFPKEFEAFGDKGFTFHVWPAHGVAKPDRQVTDAILQYLWFCHEGEALDFKVPEAYHAHKEQYTEYQYRYVRSSKIANVIGLAKTHEMLLWFHEPSESETVARTVEAWQEAPICMADPKWMCASGVFGRLHPYDPERFPRIERGLSKAYDCERRLEAYTKDYGMFNFGGGHTTWNFAAKRWADTYRCWRAFHHGAPRVPWVLYLRSGDPKYWRYAIRNARRLMDIGICHHSRPEFEKLPWPPGKIAGALRDYKGLVPWHAGSRLFDYNCCADFMLYYYYRTGDHRGMEVALEWGEAIKKHFRKPRGTRSGAGVTAALIEVYKATWDSEYKRIIDLHVNHMFDKVQNMDPNKPFDRTIPPVVADRPGNKTPVGAFPEWENYAPWIERYYDLAGDQRTGERLVAWANAYLAGRGDATSDHGSKEYCNILAYAYFITGDTKYLSHGLYNVNNYIESIQHSPGDLYDGFPHLGQMSLGPGYLAQRIPYFLSALAAHGKPIEPRGPPPGPFPLLFTRRWPEGKKHEHYDALVREEKDGAFRILATGSITYEKRVRHIVVKAPSGKEVLNKEYECVKGPLDFKIDVPADGETGVYKLAIYGTGSFWRVLSTLHTEPRMKLVYPFTGTYVRFAPCQYYFLVPKAVRAFSLSVVPGARVRTSFSIRDPDGNQAAEASVVPAAEPRAHAVRVQPKPDQTGRLWLLQGRSGQVTVKFTSDGPAIPPYFATDPALFFVP